MSSLLTRTATRSLLLVVVASTALAALLTLIVLVPTIAYADLIGAHQWQLTTLRASSAWRLSTGAGVTVGVLDSGVDAAHPDLAGRVLPGADFVDGSTDGRRDFVGHGTTVAALIAGREKTSGVVGLAPDARILPVRVLDKQNKYRDASTVADGLRWAVDHGARVVNMSLGGEASSASLADAIAYAYAHDVVIVACTGNVTKGEGNQVWYPAREPGVLAVSGLAETRSGGTTRVSLWHDALTGPATVLTAPAVDLLGAKPGGYWRVQGTSFAAPLVTAAAALIRARWPGMSAANVVNRLIRTAKDLGPPGRDDRYGFGEVNPVAALTAQVPGTTVNPLVPVAPSPQPVPTGSADPAGAGGPVVTPRTPTPEVRAVAMLRDVPRPVAVGLGAGALVFVASVGAGVVLLRRRLMS